MRRILLYAALAIASARPLSAQTFLYVTAASQQRIDIYRVANDGTPGPDRVGEKATGGIRPKRLIARGCNLYVAEHDRVEVFRVKSGGGLTLIGATKTSDASRPRDIELFPDDGPPNTLYVPVRRKHEIAAYPLDSEGRPYYRAEKQDGVLAGWPATCIFGPTNADWEDIEVENNKLYAAFTDAVEVYAIQPDQRCSNDLSVCTTDADCRRCEQIPGIGLRCSNALDVTCATDTDCVGTGTCMATADKLLRCSNDPSLPCVADSDCAPVCAPGHITGAQLVDADEDGRNDDCPFYSADTANAVTFSCLDLTLKPKPKRPGTSCTFSERGRIAGGVGLVVSGQTAIVGASFTHRMQGFVLDDVGNFPEIPIDPNAADQKKEKKQKRKQERKCRKRNRTGQNIRYIGLTLLQPASDTPIVYGAGAVGRMDAFRLVEAPPIDPNKPDDVKCAEYVPGGALILPKDISSSTVKNVASTPTRTAVGMTAGGRPVLYVAGGELDRVEAFRLFAEGGIDPATSNSPMETVEVRGSYPNDVVLIDASNCD